MFTAADKHATGRRLLRGLGIQMINKLFGDRHLSIVLADPHLLLHLYLNRFYTPTLATRKWLVSNFLIFTPFTLFYTNVLTSFISNKGALNSIFVENLRF